VNPRRLYRSRDRQLAGVAGGMAEYLDIDPTVVRILWIIVAIASVGFALLAYLILAIVIPQAPYATAPGGWPPAPSGTGAAGWGTPSATPAWGTPQAAPANAQAWGTPQAAPAWGTGPASANTGPATYPGPATFAGYSAPLATRQAESRGIGAAAIVGVVLVVIGAIALADAALPGWVAGAVIGPAVILTLGAALLVSSLRRQPGEAAATTASTVAAAPAQATSPAPTAAQAPEPAQYATPAAGMAFPAGPWETTDTQSVGLEVVAPDAGTQVDATPDEGPLPA
jgi:phage shock protein C